MATAQQTEIETQASGATMYINGDGIPLRGIKSIYKHWIISITELLQNK